LFFVEFELSISGVSFFVGLLLPLFVSTDEDESRKAFGILIEKYTLRTGSKIKANFGNCKEAFSRLSTGTIVKSPMRQEAQLTGDRQTEGFEQRGYFVESS
jgi:hypothetical protein